MFLLNESTIRQKFLLSKGLMLKLCFYMLVKMHLPNVLKNNIRHI